MSSAQDHCGACGNACGAEEVCRDGSCAVECLDGQTECDGGCHDLDRSLVHCGACGTSCDAGEVCSEGACAVSCGADLSECDGVCRDLQADPANCGACGTACGEGEVCAAGVCEIACEATAIECDGVCVDAATDPAHCGGCDVACASTEACLEGACELVCPTGQADCGGVCVDTMNDPAHCGGCDVACGTEEMCSDGACALPCAGATPTRCGTSCVDTDTDPAHCGGCGIACAAGEVCDAGMCAAACAGGTTECSGACVSTSSDPSNCGACGVTCTMPANAVPACAASACTGVCASGFGDCDGDLGAAGSDGCETTLATSQAHCGACGNVCTAANATTGCAASACVISACNAGYADCDGSFATGCEAGIATNRLHCGGCGIACATGETCASGVCVGSGTLTGESCASPYPIVDGPNTINWVATTADYLTAQPSCVLASYSLQGPDVVLSYTAAVTGYAQITMHKATNTRYVIIPSSQPCGTIEPSLGCFSDWAPVTITGQFPIIAGTTYYLYVRDTSSGTMPLNVPMQIDVAVSVPTCMPGVDGVIGGTRTTVPTGIPSLTEYYVAQDVSPTGYVYVGGTTDLYRIPKSGGTFEDVEMLAGLTTSRLGYAMLIDGNDIYTFDSKTTGTTGHVWRISRDGGATWALEDYATFPSVPLDDIHGAVVYDGEIFMVTHEGTSSSATEIWSVPTGAVAPVTATLRASIAGQLSCTSIALDAGHYYLTCGADDQLIRVNRTTTAVETVTTSIDLSTTQNELHARDHDGDGTADVLYVHRGSEAAYFVCHPTGLAPFAAELTSWGPGTSNYGLGFDPVANVLWSFDDDVLELVRIE